MSELSDAELLESRRRGARNGIFFGAFFVVLGSVLTIVAREHLWEPLGRLRPVPQILVYGLMFAAGLTLAIMSIVSGVALRRPTRQQKGGGEPPAR